jgi:fatty acid desaturase
MSQASFIKYKADYRTLATVGGYALFLPISWVLFAKFGWLGKLGLIAANCVYQFVIVTIIHNVIHVPVFRDKNWNRAFQLYLSAIHGNPVSGFVPGHNLSHHKHVQTPKDATRTTRARFRWNFLNQLLLSFIVLPDIMKAEKRFVLRMKDIKPVWSSQYKVEATLLFFLKVGLLIFDWQRALLLVIIPNIYALWGIFGANYWQHDGCDENHPYNHSRSFTGWSFNTLTFNNGYHGIHHMYMGVHWSLYPEYHERILKPHLHPALDQKSLIAFLWKSCIYPGKRLDYLGNPITLPPKVETADWVADVSIDPEAKVALGAIQ